MVAPLAPDRYKVQFTVTRETYDKLRQVQDLLRHSVPNGDPAAIFDRALTLLLTELRKRKLGLTNQPRSAGIQNRSSRCIPASVNARSGNATAAGARSQGRRVDAPREASWNSTIVIPFAAGGPTTADNLELRCRAHNAHEARGPLASPRSLKSGAEHDRLGPALLCHFAQIINDSRVIAIA